MDKIKNFLETFDSNKLINLVIALAIGVTLLVLGNTVFKKDKKEVETNFVDITDEEYPVDYSQGTYEQNLEKRLEEALSLVEGAGSVKAMITLSYSSEIVISQDKIVDESVTTETDSEGGVREVRNFKTDIRNILISENGSQKPIVIKEIEPKIEGAIIISAGGDQPNVKEALTKSATTVLGLEAHKVQVLKMKK